MRAVREIKREVGSDVAASRELTARAVKRIYSELTRGQSKLLRKISPSSSSRPRRARCRTCLAWTRRA